MPKYSLLLLLFLYIQTLTAQVREVFETPKGISERLQHEIDMTKDPALGFVPRYELVRAYQIRKRMLEQSAGLGKRDIMVWTERGPYKDVVGPSNGNTRSGNAITAGRVRAMWVDLSDPTGNTVWVGGVDGGLWKTTNITLNPAAWTPINDFFGNLAIGSICQDPTNHNIMYFGTGEKSYNADAVRGAGLWMSTDGGVNWAPMAGTSAFYNVSKMLCDAQGNLYVGCIGSSSEGMKRYTKATATWTDITPTGLDKRIPDFDISSTGRLHLVCGYFTSTNTGYRYTDNPATVGTGTWNSAVTPPPTNNNVALASSGNTLYILPASSNWQVTTIYKSTDGGVNWSPTGATPGFTSGQAWYCMAVAVDPSNANNVIVGSLDCYKSTNGGSTWTKISNWVGTSGQYVHADQQSMIWRPNNRLLVASDGGVHYSADGGATFLDRNEGLRIKQFYSVAIHPTQTDYLLGGTQDNGTHSMNQAGLASSTEVTGGDGAFVHIDQTNGNLQFGSYVYNLYRRSTNGGSSWSNADYSNSLGRFINPTDYDDANDIMYCASGNDQYLVWASPATANIFTSKTISLGLAKVSAIKVSPYTAHTVYFGSQTGTASGVLVKVTNANGNSPAAVAIGSGMFVSNGYVSSVELGTDENNIIVAYANYGIQNIWITSNGGSTWTAIDGNLPNMPVRWAMFMPGDNSKAILATETGVWQTQLINGSATVWEPETTFPNVRTDMLQYRSSDGLLAAATHGRGIFTGYLSGIALCGAPNTLTTTNIVQTSATLNWSAVPGASSYRIEYKAANATDWVLLSEQYLSLSISLPGLSAATTYNWRVRSNCSNNTIGQFVQQSFTTLAVVPVCAVTNGLLATNITSNSASLSWSAVTGASSYTLQYRLASSSSWTTVNSVTLPSYSLTGLSAGSAYQWQVRTNCSGLTSSAYTSSQFSTLAPTPCQSTYDTNSNNVYTGSSQIPFNTNVTGLINPSGDLDYYRIVITNAGTATITLTNLVTNYDLYLYSSTGSTLIKKSTLSGTTNETISHSFAAGTYYILVRGKSGSNWNASTCYTLRVQLGTASETEISEEQIPADDLTLSIFPNPVKDLVHFYLIGRLEGLRLDLSDSAGRLLYSKNVDGMLTSLDASSLPSGNYIVRISDEKGRSLVVKTLLKGD